MGGRGRLDRSLTQVYDATQVDQLGHAQRSILMEVFALRERLVRKYRDYVSGFVAVKEPDARRFVDDYFDRGRLWPEPLVQLNPAFEPGRSIDRLVRKGVLHPECATIFRRRDTSETSGDPITLHYHQDQAIAPTSSARPSALLRSGRWNEYAEYELELLTIQVQSLVDHVRDFVETTEGLLAKYSSEELNRAQDQLVERLRTTDKGLTDEDESVEWQILHGEHEWREEGVTRSFRYASVMLLHTVVEQELRLVAHHVYKQQGAQFSPEELRGSVIERYKLFFSRISNVALSSLDGWATITDLQKVRDCIAHVGGEIEPSRDRVHLMALADQLSSGISIGRDWTEEVVKVGPEFLAGAVSAISKFFDGLLKQLANEAQTRDDGGAP